MIISGMRPYAGFYEYNSIRTDGLQNTQQASSEQEKLTTAVPEANVQTAQLAQDYSAFDYAQEYQPDAQYELKGQDSDIASLDVQKAISDMQKDDVLQQYQYFVGTQDASVKKTPIENGAVSMRSGENFSL